MTTPRCGLLFHFTHISNLPGIVQAGALYSDTIVRANGLLEIEAGDHGVKQRRRERAVACPPGGVVADYVPFYFAARSPMMYVIAQGSVATFGGSCRDLVYLVTDVNHVVASGLPYVISDRNAAMGIAAFANDAGVLGDLSHTAPRSEFVDWPLMQQAMWNTTAAFPDRQERRMAEFLVHEQLPLDLLVGVAVSSPDHVPAVERAFGDGLASGRVSVRPTWYF